MQNRDNNKRGKTNYGRKKGKTHSSKMTRDSQYASNKSNDVDYSGEKHNDVSWYVADPQILLDVGRLPYSIPTGMPYGRTSTLESTNNTQDWAEPGVLTQFVMPTYGLSKTSHDPMNVAAQGLYSFVRHMNSGSRNYDPTDLMIYLCAMDSIYTYISWGCRTFATLCTYSQGNRFLPRMLLRAQHLDFDDFANNISAFRSGMNLRISKIGSLVVPNVMPIFQRHSWLFSNYYIEGETIKDQIYQYAPLGYYQFALDSNGIGMLKAHDYRYGAGGSHLTMSEYFSQLDSMIDSIMEQEDFGIMSGDIFKAYNGHILSLSLLPDFATIDFAYDEKVLLQFKNAKCHHVSREGSGSHEFKGGFFDIEQHESVPGSGIYDILYAKTPLDSYFGYNDITNGWIDVNVPQTPGDDPVAVLAANTHLYALAKPILLTSPHSDVSPEENMINTRGTMAFSLKPYSGTLPINPMYVIEDYAVGSEWYSDFTITTLIRDNSTRTISLYSQNVNTFNIATLRTTWSGQQLLNKLTDVHNLDNMSARFKYHPEYTILSVYEDSGTYGDNARDISCNFEVDNYSVQAFDTMKVMHNAALLGEFNIPRIAVQV